jgi:hypothetical protein
MLQVIPLMVYVCVCLALFLLVFPTHILVVQLQPNGLEGLLNWFFLAFPTTMSTNACIFTESV